MARSVWDNFDPDDDFVVVRPFKISGAVQVVGAAFDRSLVSTRLLRQLAGAGEIRRVDAPIAMPLEPLQVRHVGRGRFVVFRGEERMSDLLSRADADKVLADCAA